MNRCPLSATLPVKYTVKPTVNIFHGGVLATFDGPARAIRCASAITDSAERLGGIDGEWRLFTVKR